MPWAIVEHPKGGRIVGAEAVAPNAAELLGEATVAVRVALTVQDVTYACDALAQVCQRHAEPASRS